MAAGVKGQKQTKFDPTNHISALQKDSINLIGAKFSMDILIDPRNNPADFFSFFSKSKMAAAAITANYEISHNLKSIQLRDPIFFLDPCFKGKECNEAIICVKWPPFLRLHTYS